MNSEPQVSVNLNLTTALNFYQRDAQFKFFKNSSHEFTTFSGVELRILDFQREHVRLEDIAHGLSNLCRYGGQCKRFYSVAEHSVLVSRYVEYVSTIPGIEKDAHAHLSRSVEQVSAIPGIEKDALMHDGSEAYLIDLPGPLKVLCPGYMMIEERFERVIFEAFGLRYGFRHPVVKECDFRMYLRERSVLMPGKDELPPSELDDLLQVRCLTPEVAKRAFLERAEDLGISLAS